MSHPSGNPTAISSKVSHQIYGSSLLGEYRGGRKAGQLTTGLKSYELSNHLGNVLATVSDAKVAVEESGSFSHFAPEVVSATDYYPFGLAMEGRTFSGEGYRWGFNGMERDGQIAGEHYDFGARIYNAETGRFFSLDPKVTRHTWNSPFGFAANSPIVLVDQDGEIPVYAMAVGALLGGIGEMLSQASGNYFDKKLPLKKAFSLNNFDYSDLTIAVTFGALSGVWDPTGSTKFIRWVSKKRNQKIIKVSARFLFETGVGIIENVVKNAGNLLDGGAKWEDFDLGAHLAGALVEAGLGQLIPSPKWLAKQTNRAQRKLHNAEVAYDRASERVTRDSFKKKTTKKQNKLLEKLEQADENWRRADNKKTAWLIALRTAEAVRNGTGKRVGNIASDQYGGFKKAVIVTTRRIFGKNKKKKKK